MVKLYGKVLQERCGTASLMRFAAESVCGLWPPRSGERVERVQRHRPLYTTSVIDGVEAQQLTIDCTLNVSLI